MLLTKGLVDYESFALFLSRVYPKHHEKRARVRRRGRGRISDDFACKQTNQEINKSISEIGKNYFGSLGDRDRDRDIVYTSDCFHNVY